jgi:hypothetical protein
MAASGVTDTDVSGHESHVEQAWVAANQRVAARLSVAGG